LSPEAVRGGENIQQTAAFFSILINQRNDSEAHTRFTRFPSSTRSYRNEN
jgi:hypothetical protein